MSGAESRKRVAVIIPQYRVWTWHQKAISALERTYDVDVYMSALAPRYPFWLRLWLFLERYILGELPLAKFTVISAVPWQYVDQSTYSFILNLSEAPFAESNCPILEARFGDQIDSLRLVATLLACKNPFLSIGLVGQEKPVVASYLAIQDRIVLSRGLQSSYARLTVLTERAAYHFSQALDVAMLPKAPSGFAPYSALNLLLFITRFFLGKTFGRLLRKVKIPEYWSIALLWADRWNIPNDVPLHKFRVLPDDGRRFYADPFVFTDNGQKWLFVEELDYRTNKGIISCAKVTEEETCEQPRPVLERAYHLSYPFVFRHNGEIYMIPETGSNRTVELYQARSFPFEWELSRVLLKDVALYDATLLRHQDKWWLFSAVAHDAGSAQDELAIFHSDLLEGPWEPHPLNPVKSDCRSARPAGHIIFDGDRLLRPAQDCERGYGGALVWLEINELTLHHFSEREIARWPGSAALHADGIHTFNCDGRLGVIDMRRVIWKWPFRSFAL